MLGDLTINYVQRRVSLAGSPIHLTATEYGLLAELAVNAGRILTHDELLRRVWGVNHSVGRGAVRSSLKRLRHKLREDGNNPKYIFAESRVGYRMADPEETAEPQ